VFKKGRETQRVRGRKSEGDEDAINITWKGKKKEEHRKKKRRKVERK